MAANTENTPPLSPPLSARKPSTRNSIHAFFTPRHRAPLGEVPSTNSTRNGTPAMVSSSANATPTQHATPTPNTQVMAGGGGGTGIKSSGLGGITTTTKNVHLMSPEDSPSVRVAKKARRSLFQLGGGGEEDALTAPTTPTSNRGSGLYMSIPGLKGKRLFGDLARKAGAGGNVLDESVDLMRQQQHQQQEEVPLKEPVRRLRPTTNNRVLMRMIGSGSVTGMRTQNSHHCLDWRTEVEGFHSRPEDSHMVYTTDGRPSLPFTAKACHQNSLVGIGDESGGVRLIESEKGLSPGFSKVYLGIICHDNAVFDISWSPDDHQLATASGDQTARVFDVSTQTCTNILAGHRSSVKQVAFNPRNPNILTTCARDGNIHIWDLRCVGTPSELGRNITEHKPVNSINQAHSEPDQKKSYPPARPDVSVTAAVWLINRENTIATACEANSCVKIWDIRSIQTRRKTPAAVEFSATPAHHKPPKHRPFGLNSLSLSPDGTRMYAMCRDSVVYAYATSNIQNGPIHAYSHPRLHASTFYVKTSVSRDGRLLGTGSSDGIAVVFPTDEKYLDPHAYRSAVRHPEDYPVPPRASSILGTPSGKATGGIPAVAKYMKVGKGVGLVRGHEKEVTDVTWSLNGDLVAISDDHQARCWRVGGDEEGQGITQAAEELRDGGEDEGRRWGCGWASKAE